MSLSAEQLDQLILRMKEDEKKKEEDKQKQAETQEEKGIS